MRFSSLIYFGFLLVVVTVLWLLPTRARRSWLLISSYAFYGSWHYPYLILLFSCAALNHWGAKWIVAGADRKKRGAWVLAANVLLLATYKYLDWLIGDVNLLAGWVGVDRRFVTLNWILPLGISFYVFEAISYTVDIIRKRERIHSFWDFQLFIAFFPKLIAGPIMRAKELLPQIEKPEARLTSADALEGLWLIATGMFLKAVLADGIAPNVDAAFARSSGSVGAIDVWVMGAAFGLQIYFDFSSYTRLAIGSARLCGIRLVDNFNYPYSAHTPVEFWNRWHMSLSRWIRDYLFYPLLGKKATLGAMCRAAVLSMTICGVWHGAGWTYVLWGFYHGLLIAGYHLATFRGRSASAPPAPPSFAKRAIGVVITCGLVWLGWILFRSQQLDGAVALITRALQPWRYRVRALPGTMYLQIALLIAATWLVPVLVAGWKKAFPENRPTSLAWDIATALAQGTAIGGMIALSLLYLHNQTAFIYFQF